MQSCYSLKESTELTPREIQLLQHMANGLSNKQIAQMDSITEQTVKNENTSLYRKLAVCTRIQAVIAAIQRGIIIVNAPLRELSDNGESTAEEKTGTEV